VVLSQHSGLPTQSNSALLKRIIDKIQGLPTLPGVVSQLLTLARDPNSSVSDIENILSTDPSLTMKVMRVTNSSFYGYGNIKSLHEAVVILGFPAIRSIVLAASVFEAFPGASRPGFDRVEFWRHSLAVGVASRLFAMKIIGQDVEEAFIAGLVHDIGKIVMDEYASDLWQSALTCSTQNQILLFEAEMKQLGFSHSQIGQWLATKWKLPSAYIAAIFSHHQPTFAQQSGALVAVVHISDILARTLNLGSGGDPYIPKMDPEAWNQSTLKEEVWDEVLADLPEAFERAHSSFLNSKR
jgi:putative nucleotidyltransferase with HDIG domain